MRYAGVVEYEGTRYCGWQLQPNGVSVQQKLEEALEALYGSPVRVTGSGRTDAGVHARGQVFHFDPPRPHPPGEVLGALNARLPDDIAVQKVIRVSGDFHARYHAVRKEYSYLVLAGGPRPALLRNFCRHVPWELDDAAMREAAAVMQGEHDFRPFTTEAAARENCRRNMELVAVEREGRLVRFRFRASGFLYNLVRALSWSLVEAGRGRTDAAAVARVLETGRRDSSCGVAPAKGLTLEWVEYEGYPELRRTGP